MQTIVRLSKTTCTVMLLLALALLLALPLQAQDSSEDSIFVSVRLYDGIDPQDQSEIARLAAEGFLPILNDSEGFIAYFILLEADRLAAINLFETEEQATASNEAARDFVAENMVPLLPNPPQIVSGLVDVGYMAPLDAMMMDMDEEGESDEADDSDEMADEMMEDVHSTLYAALRVYDDYDIDNLVHTNELVETMFLPLQQEMEGFFGYFSMNDGEDKVAAFSIYDSEENALASNDAAANFIAEHLAQWMPEGDPQRMNGRLWVAALAEYHEGANLIDMDAVMHDMMMDEDMEEEAED